MVLIFLGLAILPMALFGLLFFNQCEKSLREQSYIKMKQTMSLQKLMVERYMGERLQDAITLAETKRVRSMEVDLVTDAAQSYFNIWKVYESVMVANTDGKTIFNTGWEMLDIADRPYFQKALQGEANISDVFISHDTGHIVLAAAAPVKRDGEVVGVAVGTVPVVYMSEILRLLEIGETGEAYLVNKEGYFITPSRFTNDLKEARIIKERSELELQAETEGVLEALGGKQGVKEYRNYRKIPVVGAYAPVEGTNGWAILVEQDPEEVFASIYVLRNIAMFLAAGIIVLTILLALWFAGNLNGPLAFMYEALQGLSRGELTRNIPTEIKEKILRRKDEYGAAGAGLKSVEDYMIDLVGKANRIAEGDLTVDIVPRSEKDELGIALKQMTENLRQLVSEVNFSTRSLDEACAILETAVLQTSGTLAQISLTIQQVTVGITQQTDNTTRTAASTDKVMKAVEGVARGASQQARVIAQVDETIRQLAGSISGVNVGTREQAQRMDRANTSMDDMMDALARVGELSEKVAGEASVTTRTANEGGEILDDTIQGIQMVQTTTEALAKRVAEFGKRAAQIGAIVDTIDDIAAQTNLLSLNAAIEAARAGEHGKGFAVVADEVRKLADRTAQETKEISDMIANMLAGIQDVEKAMQAAGKEVVSAVGRADHAGNSFQSILQAMNNLAKQIEGIRSAVVGIREAGTGVKQIMQEGKSAAEVNNRSAMAMALQSDDIMQNLESISAVVEDNNASAEEMAASTFEVTQAVESIATLAEENGSAMEEVSSSTEEITKQMEALNESTARLAEMSQSLTRLVARFSV